jgi:hypothetical protein
MSCDFGVATTVDSATSDRIAVGVGGATPAATDGAAGCGCAAPWTPAFVAGAAGGTALAPAGDDPDVIALSVVGAWRRAPGKSIGVTTITSAISTSAVSVRLSIQEMRSLGNRVIAARTKWVTAADPAESKPATT